MQFHINIFIFWRKVIFFEVVSIFETNIEVWFFLRLIFREIYYKIGTDFVSFQNFFLTQSYFFLGRFLIDIFINLIKENLYSKGCYLDKKESQDMRIRKPKLEKEMKGNWKGKKKKTRKCDFIVIIVYFTSKKGVYVYGCFIYGKYKMFT